MLSLRDAIRIPGAFLALVISQFGANDPQFGEIRLERGLNLPFNLQHHVYGLDKLARQYLSGNL